MNCVRADALSQNVIIEVELFSVCMQKVIDINILTNRLISLTLNKQKIVLFVSPFNAFFRLCNVHTHTHNVFIPNQCLFPANARRNLILEIRWYHTKFYLKIEVGLRNRNVCVVSMAYVNRWNPQIQKIMCQCFNLKLLLWPGGLKLKKKTKQRWINDSEWEQWTYVNVWRCHQIIIVYVAHFFPLIDLKRIEKSHFHI